MKVVIAIDSLKGSLSSMEAGMAIKNGATYVYGPQKGVTENMKKQLDEDMAHFARVTSETLGNDYRDTPGAGAAGGLGFAFLS